MGIKVNEVINQGSTSGACDAPVTEHEGQQNRGGKAPFSCLIYTDHRLHLNLSAARTFTYRVILIYYYSILVFIVLSIIPNKTVLTTLLLREGKIATLLQGQIGQKSQADNMTDFNRLNS